MLTFVWNKNWYFKVFESQIGAHLWWTGATDINREGKWYWTNSGRSLGAIMANEDDGGSNENFQCLNHAADYAPFDCGTDASTPYFICQFSI